MKEIIYSIKKAIKDGAVSVILASIINKVFSLISSIVVVRLLSIEEYGTLSYVESAYTYLIIFAGFGLGNALLRFIPLEKNDNRRKAYLKYSLIRGGALQITISIVFAVVFINIAQDFIYVRELILLFILKPLLQYIYDTFQYYYRALELNSRYARLSILYMVSTVVYMIIGAFLYKLFGVPFARYFAYITVLCVIIHFSRKEKSLVTDVVITKSDRIVFWKYGISLTIATMLSSILPNNDIMILSNVLKDEKIIAIYKVALAIPLSLTFISNSALIYVYPKFVKHSDDGRWILRNTLKLMVACSCIVLPVAATIYVLSPQVISLIYGAQYLDAVPIMRLLLISISLNACIRMIPMSLLAAIGYAKENSIIAFLTLIFQFVFDFTLIRMFGVNGAPIALMSLYAVTSLIYIVLLYKRCREKWNTK